jgi:hypothetical protein
MSQIIGIVSSCEEVLPEIENGNLLSPFKFDLSEFARLAHDAIDFDHAFVVDEVENGFPGE